MHLPEVLLWAYKMMLDGAAPLLRKVTGTK